MQDPPLVLNISVPIIVPIVVPVNTIRNKTIVSDEEEIHLFFFDC